MLIENWQINMLKKYCKVHGNTQNILDLISVFLKRNESVFLQNTQNKYIKILKIHK